MSPSATELPLTDLEALENPEEAHQQGIQSIEVGARVLQALANGRGPTALSDVARRSATHPAKAHRYLVSLVRVGLATRDPRTGRYDLGPAARNLGVEALRRMDPESIASQYALRLRDDTGHTVDVAVWSESGPVIVRWDSGVHALPMMVRVGSVLPLLDSALGLVFLAHLPRPQTAAALAAQQARGETRRVPAAEQESLLEQVRRDGHASALNNMIYGMAAYAAPVFGPDGQVALALGLAVPARLLAEGDTSDLAQALHTAVAEASAELGHRPQSVLAGSATPTADPTGGEHLP